jgi:beta-lactamase superfamily II metal-dependent hydrolase
MSPVVSPVRSTTLRPAESKPGSFVNAVRDNRDALLYFLLNVGDGDTQLLVLPPSMDDDKRGVVIVDAATPRKLPSLLRDLASGDVGILPTGELPKIPLLVATHPHADHIGGIGELLDMYNGPEGSIDQVWEPGFWYPSPSFHNLMRRLEVSSWLQRLQPTSGTTMHLGAVKITVVGPGVGLRTRFDTYGIGVNDSSITLMIEYPAAHIFTEVDGSDPTRRNRRLVRRQSRRILLGADAQFHSWAQATVDFPNLAQEFNPTLHDELRAATGRDYLAADVFKLSHHASKHGISLELLERVGARYTLASCVAGGGKYNFPHALAMDAAREARMATAASGAKYRTDHELGIHLTGSHLSHSKQPRPLGSIAVLVPATRSSLRLFRFMDGPRDPIDLTASREVVT